MELDEAPRVWYAAYGSNMCLARLRYYLAGGCPPGARRVLPGCRDTREPAAIRPIMLPGGIYFALDSSQWTGGVALYDPHLSGTTAARAYLLTAGQFADVVAQEMRREPGTDLDQVLTGGTAQLGPGPYETLVHTGEHDGHPVLTFTAPWAAGDVATTSPAAPYVAMLAGGLREAHGWPADRIVRYLAPRRGIAGAWSTQRLREVVEAAVGQ
ncbi:histone deacetylase [Actinoplanes sp. NPDC024001]|uniref:histone deacetylase n=1 Tax=Actinoplanes sp. NPDC024001 TaxID=3154598 RepID=UPI00340B36DD